jgi:hypothetical protein
MAYITIKKAIFRANIFTILKAPVSTVVMRRFFTKKPLHFSKSTQRKIFKKRCSRWGLNPHPNGRRMKNIVQNCLTSRTLCSVAYNIEYKLYICIYDFFVK